MVCGVDVANIALLSIPKSKYFVWEYILLTITAAQLSLLQSAQEIVLMMDCHYFWNATVCFDEAWMVSKKGGKWQLVFGTDLSFAEAFRAGELCHAPAIISQCYSILFWVISGVAQVCNVTICRRNQSLAKIETLKDEARFENSITQPRLFKATYCYTTPK